MQTLSQLRSGAWRGTTSLKLSEELTEFPAEIFELADTLEVLDLSRNKLNSLPVDFGRLKKLKILFCSDNEFTVLPEALADCPMLEMVGFKSNKIEIVPARSINPNLRWLILTNNCIAKLPKEIGNCPRMQKLALAGNKLTNLPVELSNCRNLALLRISANRLIELPQWLLHMPKLAWLAFAGNLFNVKPFIQPLPVVAWQDLQIQHMLGEGASGIIFKAMMREEIGEKDVAVKVFKGAVTSDGLPEDEMNASIIAGAHVGLVRLIGQITGHPDDRKGLVMELIPESYSNLGLPPSFETCTRDVFVAGATLSLEQVLNIAGTIASVAAQLHSKGILHGDLYAHNTLVDKKGNTLFGDFGAASFYGMDDTKTAVALESLDVCAFGHLIDDLVSLCASGGDNPVLHKLSKLRDAATAPDVMSRPGFQQLDTELASMQAQKSC